jgi:rare lipoprotein A (peptidoglycan hydrolase)
MLGALALWTGSASPAVAADGSGGYGYGEAPADIAVAATDAGTLSSRATALLGRTLTVRGTIAGAGAGQAVQLERQDVLGAWAPATTATTAPDGSFVARWRTDVLGTVTLRAVPAASEGASASSAAAQPTRIVTVLKPATATWYGPGLWGKATACGQTLTRDLLGVAHKTLPCGTAVQLGYRGRTLTVPVVDRGPFRKGTTYDLTKATAEQLGVTATVRLGVLRAG